VVCLLLDSLLPECVTAGKTGPQRVKPDRFAVPTARLKSCPPVAA